DPCERDRIRDHITAAVQAGGADMMQPTFAGGARPETIEFLRSFDLGFRIRRLRLLARRLTEIEEDYAEEELAPIREAIYGALAR
ncbi:hypothetical protein, partial [Enterococcus faecalis]|uniref:hypothetical protein n=1 Tax=Enterococcus faecalis TaxID=1351 RepID=UPI00403F5893